MDPIADQPADDGVLVSAASLAKIGLAVNELRNAEIGVTGSPSPDGLPDEDRFAIKIVSSSSTSTGPEYVVKVMREGASDATHAGLLEIATPTYKARNVVDQKDGGGSGGTPVPDGTVIGNAFWSSRASDKVILFSHGGSGGGGAKRFTLGGSGGSSVTGTADDGSTATILLAQVHSAGDLVWATPADASVGANQFVEIPFLPKTGQRYQVLQVVDGSGRLGLDWLRAH